MNIEVFRDHCLNKKGVTEECPFGPDAIVFKVMGKMFALAELNSFPLRVNLKCDPVRAVELREEYDGCILPGYHMNKKHWNTMIIDGRLDQEFVDELIEHSYDLVKQGLTKKQQQELENLQ